MYRDQGICAYPPNKGGIKNPIIDLWKIPEKLTLVGFSGISHKCGNSLIGGYASAYKELIKGV
jgi:hypothetical protein